MILKIYDILGHWIQTLVNQPKPAGEYTVIWNGTDNTGQIVSSGIYIYQLQADAYSEIKKLILIR